MFSWSTPVITIVVGVLLVVLCDLVLCIVGFQHWTNWISWHRMGQPWIRVTFDWLHVRNEMCSRWKLFYWWITALWEHWIEPLLRCLELWTGSIFQSLYSNSVSFAVKLCTFLLDAVFPSILKVQKFNVRIGVEIWMDILDFEIPREEDPRTLTNPTLCFFLFDSLGVVWRFESLQETRWYYTLVSSWGKCFPDEVGCRADVYASTNCRAVCGSCKGYCVSK